MTTTKPSFKYLDIFTALFVMTLIVSNIASIKLVSLGSQVFDAGTILFPLAYIIGDVVTEIYGYNRMRRMILIGLGMAMLTTLTFWVVGMLPAAADWTGQDAYSATLGTVWRIVGASITAIFLGEIMNSFVLAKLKVRTKGRNLWARLIGSSVVGNAIDTTVFSVIAFAGIIEASVLFDLIVTVFLIKMAVEIGVSPITVKLIGVIKKRENQDSFEEPVLVA